LEVVRVAGGAGPLTILAVDAGSSSLRMDLWHLPAAAPALVLEAGGIGGAQGTIVSAGREERSPALPDHVAAAGALAARLPSPGEIARIGHRLVHGGPTYRDPVWIDDTVLRNLDAVAPLLPLHLPPALGVIRHFRQAYPAIPEAAVFDTAFHATLPAVAYEYAVPASWREWGVRRYGFHGLACADAVFQLGDRLRERAVQLHLGAGCSATAMLRGRSIDTTMGLTPLEGLMMATRCGDLDPAILLYLQRDHGYSVAQLDADLNRHCGLLGLSGRTGDMKTLLEGHDPDTRLAVDVFCYRAAKAIGALAVALEGCDQIIFSGGIGEHAGPIRAGIIGRLGHLGAKLDQDANASNAAVISGPQSSISIEIVRIDEGRQIARATAQLPAPQRA
jgi:acetate kinase